MIKIILILLIAIAQVNMKAIELTDKDFDQHIKENKVVFVKFYAPWCGHCKAFAKKYDKIAEDLSQKGISIAKINADQYRKIGKQQGIKGYPTLKLFLDGQAISYNGGRKGKDIEEFIKKAQQPVFELLANEEQLNKAKTDNKMIAVLYSNDENSDEVKYVSQVAKSMKNFDKFYVYKQADAQAQFVVYKQYDELKAVLNDKLSVKSIKKFINQNSIQLVHRFQMRDVSKIDYKKTMITFSLDKNNNEYNQQLFKILDEIKFKYMEKFQILYFYNSDKAVSRQYNSDVGKKLIAPQILFQNVNPNSQQIKNYLAEFELSKESIENLIQKFNNNEIEQIFKSEQVPESQNEPVKTVVYKNFEQMVQNNDQDVLMFYYAEWCGYCKKFKPVYNKFAKLLQESGNEQLQSIMLAKYNAEKNDHVYPVEGYPTLVLYKKGQKPKEYKGGQSQKSLLKFLKQNSSVEASAWEQFEQSLGSDKQKTKKNENIKQDL